MCVVVCVCVHVRSLGRAYTVSSGSDMRSEFGRKTSSSPIVRKDYFFAVSSSFVPLLNLRNGAHSQEDSSELWPFVSEA